VSVLIVINPVHAITTHFKINFLGMFAKLPKTTSNFVMPVCPSVCMEKLGSHWKDFHEILYSTIFQKPVEKMQVSLKSDKNNGYINCRPIYIFGHISLNSS